jgi:hypothetical protein
LVGFELRFEMVKCRESQVESRSRSEERRAKSKEHSPSPFPLSPSPFRRGISLTEVLISLGILTIGLLGVAALFPVGSYYMQKGDIAQNGSAIAQAAFNEVLARGILNPDGWYMLEDSAVNGTPANPQLNTIRYMFYRNVGDWMRRQRASTADMSPGNRQWNAHTEFGSVFVIDPLGVSSISTGGLAPDAPYDSLGRAGIAPSTSYWLTGNPPSPQWQPWFVDPPTGANRSWPIRRVTLKQASLLPALTTVQPMQAATAARQFVAGDDLSLDLPPQADRPAAQRWSTADVDDDDVLDPLARQSQGDYSWIVTVAPTSFEARDSLSTDPAGSAFEVSVAVFYKRVVEQSDPMQFDQFEANLDLLRRNERTVTAKIVSTGLSGGEVLLERAYNDPIPVTDESPFANLKTGQWIMLCGPHPNSTNERPNFVARWYRVLSIEGKETRLNAQGVENQSVPTTDPERRLVALRGPQWPWQPATDLTETTLLSNNLCGGIFANVVAVHSKTVRLERNSLFGGGIGGSSTTWSPGSPYSPY